jgi:hypothetical protein
MAGTPKRDKKAPYGYTRNGKPRQRPLKTGAPPIGGRGGKPTGKSSTGKVEGVNAKMATWRRQMQLSRIKFDDDQKALYISQLNMKPLKQFAADAAGVSTQTVSEHYKNDPDFAEQVDVALARHRDRVIEHHHHLVFVGEHDKTFDKDDKLIRDKQTIPIALVQLEIKKVEPAYNDRSSMDVDVKGGGGVIVAPSEVSPMKWMKRENDANKTRKPPEGHSDD